MGLLKNNINSSAPGADGPYNDVDEDDDELFVAAAREGQQLDDVENIDSSIV